jgi:hypothetical protein
MKISELIVESQDLDEISLSGVGRTLAKGVGGTARAVGSVAGGIAGIGAAAKQGYAAGKTAVSGEPNQNTTASAPVAPASSLPTVPAPQVAPTMSTTAYTQAKGMIDKLNRNGKQRILAKLQKELGSTTPAPTAAPTLRVQPGGRSPAATATPESKIHSNFLGKKI